MICLFSSFILQRFDADIAEGDRAVVALEKDRAGLIEFVVQFAPCRPIALDVVMNLHAVEDKGDFVAHNGGFGRLPFAGFLGSKLRDGLLAVNGAVPARTGLAAVIVIEDLDFISAPQVKAAGPGRSVSKRTVKFKTSLTTRSVPCSPLLTVLINWPSNAPA